VDVDEFETVIVDTWFLEGLFAENDTATTSGIWERVVAELLPVVKQNRMLGRALLSQQESNDSDDRLHLKDVTHFVRDLRIVPGGVWGSLELIHCPSGDDVISLFKGGVQFKASWVGQGCRQLDVFGIPKEFTHFKVNRFDLAVVR
jgi:hypothetical protein